MDNIELLNNFSEYMKKLGFKPLSEYRFFIEMSEYISKEEMKSSGTNYDDLLSIELTSIKSGIFKINVCGQTSGGVRTYGYVSSECYARSTGFYEFISDMSMSGYKSLNSWLKILLRQEKLDILLN